MTKLRILIVDDEEPARTRIRSLLADEASMEVVGECETGPAALAAIREQRPDVALLDILLPGCDGLQVIRHLTPGERPAVILVTAHQRFALEAFAVQAVDYLLKPFDQPRLQLALRRAATQLQARRAIDPAGAPGSPPAEMPPRQPPRLAFRTEGRVVFLRSEEIAWVAAANNHCVLHLATGPRHRLRETLTELEQRLSPAGFARINRSTLVCLDRVRELQPGKSGNYRVVLRDGSALVLSRNFHAVVEKLVAQRT
jgi:two-component system LytT family response regulator